MKNWNINHAHLSNKKDERKNQSSRLLFFTKENDTIYFIDVIKHPKGHEWFQRRFLEIIDNNWPWLLREVPGVTKLLDPISDTDMQKATSKSFVFYELNNRVIAPTNLGVASDGTSNYAVRKIFHILELLDFWQKEFQENMEKLIGDIKEQNQIEIDKPLQLSLIIEDDLFLAYDEYYQIKIPMFHEP
jgi:deferrochelatase/peroxidase EfeB